MNARIRRLALALRRRTRTFVHRVARLLPRPSLAATPHARVPIRRIVVFARLPNPTVDFYLTARLAAPGMPPSQIVDIRDPAVAAVDPDGAFVIVCRYASRRAVAWIDRHAGRLAGVGFFTDDDVGAVVTGGDARFGYRLFLYGRALAHLRRLNRHMDVVWTATPALAEAIGGDRVRVLPPAPHPRLWASPATSAGAIADGEVRIVYHATGVHLREHRFLAPIVAEVLRARPRTVFEVTADERAARHWAGMERVTIDPPTSWPDYLERTRNRGADIAVVPLLDSRANRARAGTKRIDVVRLGAAGVFSCSSAYGADDGAGEIRLRNRRHLWIGAILRLVDDASLRAEVALASRRLVEAMSRDAERGIPGLGGPFLDVAADGGGDAGPGDPPPPRGTDSRSEAL